ncbi:MAG: DUF547 domain-containing protein [Nitrospinae bacterium]|nr:DUF547 domain-containing protein [Nitrospinota bacterium]
MSLYRFKIKKQLKDLKNKMSRIRFEKLWVLMVCILLIPSSAWAFDFSGWDALVKKYVGPTTIAGIWIHGVRYSDLKKDPAYSKLIHDLKTFSPSKLKSAKDKLCFWINVYNIMAVKMVLDHYPVDSIKDAGGGSKSVWKKTAGVVGGKEVTLHEIEHEILRKMGDPRIHAAIVCASVSCPDLRKEAYTKERLDQQLDDQLKRFLANKGKGLQTNHKDGRILLSKIFDWFEDDFEPKGGVLPFLARYAPEPDRSLLKNGDADVSYLDYNWDLNKR